MGWFYSKSKNEFFSSGALSRPGDSVPISASSFSEIMANLRQGGSVSANSNGQPVALPPPPISLQEQAMAALAGGVTIKSTGTPSLDGTYACQGSLFNDMMLQVGAIGAGLGLIGGGTTMSITDQSGKQHVVTEAQFLAIAGAVRNFAGLCKQIASGASGINSLPSVSVTIS